MAQQVEAEAVRAGGAQTPRGDASAADLAALAATLVGALEQTLMAAHRLRNALATAGGCVGSNGLEPSLPEEHAGGPSRREMEVLRLIAVGRSNGQIAAALFLSPRAVQRHVANLYLKIGTHCRAEATAYARCHGLG